MERLTIEYTEGVYVPRALCSVTRDGVVDDAEGCIDWCCTQQNEKECDNCPIQDCFNRLAEYENIGLTPEQIKEVDKLYRKKCEELAKMKEKKCCPDCKHKEECIKDIEAELEEYHELEEQGRLLKLPCTPGTTVYQILPITQGAKRIIAETKADAFFLALTAVEGKFGKSVFLTLKEAQNKLKEICEN